jgi:hypothetical protein
MKQFFLFCLLICTATWAQAQVQSCGSSADKPACCAAKAEVPSCCAGKSAATSSADASAAEQAAAADESIESRMNVNTGEVVYVQRQINDTNGAVTFRVVEFDAASGAFVTPDLIATTGCNKDNQAGATQKAGEAGCQGKAKAEEEEGESKAKAAERPRRRSSAVKLVNYQN